MCRTLVGAAKAWCSASTARSGELPERVLALRSPACQSGRHPETGNFSACRSDPMGGSHLFSAVTRVERMPPRSFVIERERTAACPIGPALQPALFHDGCGIVQP